MDIKLMPNTTAISGSAAVEFSNGDQFLEMQQAADYIHRSKSTMEKYSAKMLIPKYRPNNGKVLFKKSDLDKFVIGFRLKSCFELECEALSALSENRG